MKKKLIEVALPLEAINREAIRESYIYRGNPSAIHKWWTQKPFAVARCMLFASLVTDPASEPEKYPTRASQEIERARLFALMERLAVWESIDDRAVLDEAHAAIADTTGGQLPVVLDPFSGGATIPLEAQRLGLKAFAADLNPVAALIARGLLEFPQDFADRAPVHPDAMAQLGHAGAWSGTAGLAEDVRRYGAWLRDAALERLRDLYPQAELNDGQRVPALAWLWARTVTCPNPACGATTPLVRSFAVSTKKGGETWTEPTVDTVRRSVRFVIHAGIPAVEGTVGKRGAKCVVCGEPFPLSHIREEGLAGRLSSQLMATVVDGPLGRTYVAPDDEQEAAAARAAAPPDLLDTDLPEQALGFRVQGYGMRQHRDLYTSRQLVMLGTLSDLVAEGGRRAAQDSGGDAAYGRAIATYLAFVVDKVAQFNSSLVAWYTKENRQTHTFGQQTLSMMWNYAEGNPFAGIGGGIDVATRTVADALGGTAPNGGAGTALNRDAATLTLDTQEPILISTDPPYYDMVNYADLSDYFYVWLRRSVGGLHPDFFGTILAPKRQELIAEPARFAGDRHQARAFFEGGVRSVFTRLRSIASNDYPLTVYYAFKQAETSGDGATTSTGWETMLAGLLDAGFSITGTWPTRTERTGRLRDTGSNALASSIVLVCRPRQLEAPLATRKEFVAALRRELPAALQALQQGNIAPVDLAQASIGPGMAVFSRFARVIEADGEAMSMRSALALINQALDEQLAEQEADFDPETRWAVSWFEQFGMNDGPFGVAETLCKARNVAVDGLREAGVVVAAAGKVRLVDRDELPDDWDPAADERLTIWEIVQHLVRRLDRTGETSAANTLARLGSLGDAAKELAYRLYVICDRKGWASDAVAYNGLVASWSELTRLVATDGTFGQQAMEI